MSTIGYASLSICILSVGLGLDISEREPNDA